MQEMAEALKAAVIRITNHIQSPRTCKYDKATKEGHGCEEGGSLKVGSKGQMRAK